jgi:hypothetical protein
MQFDDLPPALRAPAAYHDRVTGTLVVAPFFERHPLRAGIAGRGTNIDISYS